MAQRFVSPIYVDLSLSEAGGSPSGLTTVSVGPVSTADLLSMAELDPADPAALALLPDPDTLLKCELDSVFDVTHHFYKELEDVEPLPLTLNATVATPVISRAPRALTSATGSERRGGRASQFTAKQRRERHNANERRRTNAAKDRVRGMRDEVSALAAEREELAVSGSVDHLKSAKEIVGEAACAGELGARIPAASTFLDLVKAVDVLRTEKRFLEEQLDVLDAQNSVLQALQCELTLSNEAFADPSDRKRKRADEAVDEVLKRSRTGEAETTKTEIKVEEEDEEDEEEGERIVHPRGGYCAETEAVPAYLCALFPRPLSSGVAFDWVKQSYGDIMAQNASRLEGDSEDNSFFGWTSHPAEEAQYLLSSSLGGVSSSELVFRSWRLLTSQAGLRTLFPHAKDLVVLQTVNDDCLVVRVGWTSPVDGKDSHSVVVLARGQIDGGYLVSARSIPLTPGQQSFAAEQGEGRYVSLLGWLMLLDTPAGCDVALGGSVESREDVKSGPEALAGAVRWQQAMGCGGGVQLAL
jgi:hypothetical protein